MADQSAANASGQMPAGYRPPARSGSTAPPPPPGSQRPKGGTGGKRYVRTQAGSTRYGKPVGTEIIAAPRDQRGAKAQTDKESTDRYKALVSNNPDQQAAAMKGLNDDQLKRLNEVAFSFQSSDQNVARLRAGVSLEMQRRGLDPNRYGGLSGRGTAKQGNRHAQAAPVGPGVEVINYSTGERYRVNTQAEKKAGSQAQTASNADERRALHEALMVERKRLADAKKATAAQLAAQKKAAAVAAQQQRQQQRLNQTRARNRAKFGQKQPGLVQLSISTQARQQAAVQGDALPGGRFPIRNIGDLRNAVAAFGRAKPGDRTKIAEFICRKAKELNAEHLLGPAIRAAAGYAQQVGLSAMVEPEVIELAGKYRHGWILIGGPNDHGGGSGELVPQHEGGKLLPKHEGGKLTPRNTNRFPPKGLTTKQVPGAAASKRAAPHPFWSKLSDSELRLETRNAHGVLSNPHVKPGSAEHKRASSVLAEANRRGVGAAHPNELTPAQVTHSRRVARGGTFPTNRTVQTSASKAQAQSFLEAHKRATRSSPTAQQRYAANAPARIKHPSLPGGVYHRNSAGTYDLHVNGKKTRSKSELGQNRATIATAARSVNQRAKGIGFSPEAAKTNLRNQGPGSAYSYKPKAVEKSIARRKRKSGQ
jgi:hypothetical protein